MSSWHPDDMTLMNYVAGSTSAPEALAIATHLSFCHECCVHVRNLNNLGGTLLETIKPATIDEDAFNSLLENLEPHARTKTVNDSDRNDANNIGKKNAADVNHGDAQIGKLTRTVESKKQFSNPLEGYLPAELNDLAWHHQTREISKFDLTALLGVKGFQVGLQKIKAGARVPRHTHEGFEYTVILRGGFSDELGVYHAGDFISRDTSHHHSPTALQNEDCICLTVLNAPLKFTGWYRILNPFMRWK